MEIKPIRWEAKLGGITVYVEKGSHGGLNIYRKDGGKEFQFSESTIETIRSFGQMFNYLANWAEEEKKKGVL